MDYIIKDFVYSLLQLNDYYDYGSSIKPIKKIKYKKSIKRMHKMLEKFLFSNIILTKSFIYELAQYIYNKYNPNGEYKKISSIKYYLFNGEDHYFITIIDDDYQCKIDVNDNDRNKYIYFHTLVYKDEAENNKSTTIKINNLTLENINGDNKYINDVLIKVNELLKRYIFEVLFDYIKENKRI